ncbi:NusG domain II-containing protein [Desemzia sp. RIT804]|uniref:NusG domain II-containing protein n=1 Tax=Desemzia sp. RIT 804 TaxID=2810209 RepID=UPI00194FB656|nr:NusG domain II-containing protein [Desemzia sp. RIT 804]MBM6615200.1 NusG domain II-containing protein [Desemzia sp. RIT 804]
MKKHLKMVRRWDIVIVLSLMLASFFPLGFFTYVQAKSGETELKAVISADGEFITEFILADDGQTEEYVYIDDHGHENTVVRDGMMVYMSDASCNDQLCVRKGDISSVGETIVCLPNHLLVEVEPSHSDAEIESDLDIIS